VAGEVQGIRLCHDAIFVLPVRRKILPAMVVAIPAAGARMMGFAITFTVSATVKKYIRIECGSRQVVAMGRSALLDGFERRA
jgi:hypothetical protein